MYHGFSVGFFWWWWWWWWLFFVSILFWGFFAILNHVAFKAVTGLMLKEDIGRISFRLGHQFTYPTVLVSQGQTKWPQNIIGKSEKKIRLQNSKSLASGHCDLKNLFAFVKEDTCSISPVGRCLGMAWWDPISLMSTACSHGHVSPWSSVQSVSSPPFLLPLLYLYCQETSFHLGLLCFVRWVLHYIMCLFLCVLWGCLEHN